MKNKLVLGLVAILILLLVWMIFFWSPNNTSNKNATNTILSAPPVGGDFSVNTQQGNLSLNDLRGKVIVLYFGYTQCPDVCPTSLALLTQALKGMTADELSEIQAIFVSVDPERDTVSHLKGYVNYFHKNIIGATAEKSTIDKITKQYGASYRIIKGDSAMGYTVDHSSYTYLIDQNGKLQKALVHGTLPNIIQTEIRKMLNK